MYHFYFNKKREILFFLIKNYSQYTISTLNRQKKLKHY